MSALDALLDEAEYDADTHGLPHEIEARYRRVVAAAKQLVHALKRIADNESCSDDLYAQSIAEEALEMKP